MTEYIIALDAMGGDNAPDAIVRGAIAALRKYADVQHPARRDQPQRLKPLVDAAGGRARSRLELIEADEVIGMDEPPMLAVRRKVEFVDGAGRAGRARASRGRGGLRRIDGRAAGLRHAAARAHSRASSAPRWRSAFPGVEGSRGC